MTRGFRGRALKGRYPCTCDARFSALPPSSAPRSVLVCRAQDRTMICERRFLRTGRAAGNLGRVNAMKRVFVIALLTLIWLGIVTGPAARKLLNVTTILVFPLRALTNFFSRRRFRSPYGRVLHPLSTGCTVDHHHRCPSTAPNPAYPKMTLGSQVAIPGYTASRARATSWINTKGATPL